MKFGVREICDVVLKAKAPQKIGNKVFYKNEPVIYFDSLKTSSMEGAATTVYAQGGRGNSRLVAWEGERTVTFTMEDALISPEGFMVLSGAGLIEATEGKPVYQHIMESTDEVYVVDTANEDFPEELAEIDAENGDVIILVKHAPYLPKSSKYGKDNYAYVMITSDGEPVSEPFIPEHNGGLKSVVIGNEELYPMIIKASAIAADWLDMTEDETEHTYKAEDIAKFVNGAVVLVDYYVERKSGARQIEITPDKFGGNYYLEASTLFRDTNGVDMPAEFIIPNCKIQSNFNFTMASSGDPSTFTFTMDAFPDYTRFDKTKKVLAAIQIIDVAGSMSLHRHSTNHESAHDLFFV